MSDLKMPQINRLELTGRLARDPELKYTQSGTATIKTSLAVDEGFGDKRCTIWVILQIRGKYAETMHPHLYKGAPIHAEGRLDVYEWETQEGEKRVEVVIVANRVQVLEWRDKDAQGNAPAPSPKPSAGDDIPF